MVENQELEGADDGGVEYPKLLMYPGVVLGVMALCLIGVSVYQWVTLPETEESAPKVFKRIFRVAVGFVLIYESRLILTERTKGVLLDGGMMTVMGVGFLIFSISAMSQGGHDFVGVLGVVAGLVVSAILISAGLAPFKCRAQFERWRDAQTEEGVG